MHCLKIEKTFKKSFEEKHYLQRFISSRSVVIYTKETSHTFDLRSGIETSSAYSRVTDYFQFIRLFVIIEKRGRIFSTRKTISEKYKQTPVYTRLPSFT